jgi:hypothetical protein
MRRQHDRHPALAIDPEDGSSQVARRIGVESLLRLIEKENVGQRKQCLSEREAPAHPMAVGADAIVDAFFESDDRNRRVDLRVADPAGIRRQETEVVATAEVIVERGREHASDTLARGRRVPSHGDSTDEYVAARRTEQSHREREQRTLPCTVVSGDDQDLTAADGKRNAIQRVMRAEALGDAIEDDDRVGHVAELRAGAHATIDGRTDFRVPDTTVFEGRTITRRVRTIRAAHRAAWRSGLAARASRSRQARSSGSGGRAGT